MKNIKKKFNQFKIKSGFLVMVFLLLTSLQLWAANETFNPGAYIIDMGTSDQTYATGLKPYGLVYDLIINENVPVRWAIDPNKLKDQIDFVADGINYRGGSFIIPVEYLSSDVLSTINTWKGKGVKVDGPMSNGFDAPIYKSLTSWPRAILDEDNGDIIADYYENAEVPTASYVLAGNPTDLTACGDIYVLPHADPHEWPDSWGQALYDFVVEDQGYLWAACHAVSALETLVNLNSGDKTNFLSNTQLKPWKDIDGMDGHDKGTPPYTYDESYSGDPIMQFIGILDKATQEGSEQIYVPMDGMTWRSTTKNAVYDPDHPDNPTGDYASVLAYGHAFGNPNYGMVMYEAGHDHDKDNKPANVAAQRAYFNFVLMAGADKEISVSSTVPAFVASGSTINISASGSDGNSPYYYEWTSSCEGGTFGDPNSSSTTYTAPITGSSVTCVITVMVTDACGRFTFESTSVEVGPADGPTANDDEASTPVNTAIDIDILDNDEEGDAAIDATSVTFISGTEPNPSTEGLFTVDSNSGLVTFTPVNGFTGTVSIDYSVCDQNSLCDEATITVHVTPVADLEITKTTSADPVLAGETFTYTIIVTNNGPSAAENVSVEDVLPSDLTFVEESHSTGSWVSPDWTIGTLANEAAATLTLTVTVKESAAGDIANTATVTSSTDDPDTDNNTSTETVSIVTGPTANNDLANTPVNTPVDIAILNNDTEGDAAIDQTSVTFISGTEPDSENEGTFTYDGNTGLATFTPVNGFTGTVTIDYQVCDLNSYCDDATITVIVTEVLADLEITKVASTDPVLVGETFTYTITVKNNGPDNAENVVVNEVLPASLNFEGESHSTGSWSAPNWTIGTIANGDSETLTISVTIKAGETGNIVNTATVSSTTDDPDDENNTSTETVTISEPDNADLAITKVASKDPVEAGDTFTYTIAVTNNGPNEAEDVVVNDLLPLTKIILNDNNPSKGTWSAPNWNIGDLANGESVTLVFTVTVKEGAMGNITNTATVTSTTDDPNNENNTSTEIVDIEEGEIINNFPATGYGTLAYEDLWPGKGDYDFNDLVLDYKFEIATNINNKVEQVKGTFIIKAFGAALQNGFGFQLSDNINAGDLNVSGYSLTENFINLNSNGTEAGQTKPTIIVYDNAYNQMAHPGVGIGVNTETSAPYVTPDTISIVITFPSNQYSINDLDISNFNPFLIVDLNRGVEVHLPDYPPTDLADQSIFGTYEDDSNAGTGKYYKTINNLPWAIHIYETFDYPSEKKDITWTHLKFAEWATSGGISYPDWYQDISGYRNNVNIYQLPF